MNTIKTLTVNGKQYALTDDWARERLVQESARVDHLADACPIVCEAHGQVISALDSAEYPIRSLRLFGKTVQSPTPSPVSPAVLESAGASGSIGVSVAGKNLLNVPENIRFTQKYSATELGLFAGKYVVSCGAVSTDGHRGVCAIGFYNDDTLLKTVNLRTDTKAAITFDAEVTRFIMYSNGWDYASSANVAATVDQLMVSLDGGEYEPYKTAQKFAVSTPDGLHGIPVTAGGNYTDENGQQWLCDVLDLTRGVYVQHLQRVVFDKNSTVALDMQAQSPATNVRFNFVDKSVLGIKKQETNKPQAILCNYAPAAKAANNTGVWVNNTNDYFEGQLSVDSSIAGTVEEMKALLAVTPIEFIVPLDKPMEKKLSEAFAGLRSYRPVTFAYNDAGAEMGLAYIADTKTYIDNAIAKAIGG